MFAFWSFRNDKILLILAWSLIPHTLREKTLNLLEELCECIPVTEEKKGNTLTHTYINKQQSDVDINTKKNSESYFFPFRTFVKCPRPQ